MTAEPGLRQRTPTRPYGGKRGGPPSVTTVLAAMAVPGLPWAAAKETAMFAVEKPEEWQGLAPEDAVARLYRHHRGIWDGRAEMGTLVHAVNEAWTWGEEVDLDTLVDGAANRDKKAVKSWQGREALVVGDLAGYVDGLERFWCDFSPVTVATEEVVRYRRDKKAIYIGQRDWVAELEGLPGRTLIDIKTTAQQDAEKGWYPESWRLQGAAYRYANEIVDYDAEGNETGTRPNYTVERFAILHMRGDGDYELVEYRAAGDEHGTFLRLVTVYEWMTKGAKTPEGVRLNPIAVPNESEAA